MQGRSWNMLVVATRPLAFGAKLGPENVHRARMHSASWRTRPRSTKSARSPPCRSSPTSLAPASRGHRGSMPTKCARGAGRAPRKRRIAGPFRFRFGWLSACCRLLAGGCRRLSGRRTAETPWRSPGGLHPPRRPGRRSGSKCPRQVPCASPPTRSGYRLHNRLQLSPQGARTLAWPILAMLARVNTTYPARVVFQTRQ